MAPSAHDQVDRRVRSDRRGRAGDGSRAHPRGRLVVRRGAADLRRARRVVRPASSAGTASCATTRCIGHARFLLEEIRPEIQQYFVESNTEGRPYDRETRDLVYDRAKGNHGEEPFGTQRDVNAVGYEFVAHSLRAKPKPDGVIPSVRLGGPKCTQPYDIALLNVSAMSFGSMSGNAIEALNAGAAMGGFAHDTGEGSISRPPPQVRRRPDLGDRHGLLRLPHAGRPLRPRQVQGAGVARPGEGDLDQDLPGREARARRAAAGRQGERGGRRGARRGDRARRSCRRRRTTPSTHRSG